jgi:hypothetical protein
MDWAALERIVEILAMNRGAVDQSRGDGRERARMSDRGAWPIIVASREHALRVVFVARGDGEADDVDQ